MARGRTRTVLARRLEAGAERRQPSELIVEEPLTIMVGDQRVATTMRTPGNDFELAVGFLHSEGLLDEREVETVRYCGTGAALDSEFNVVTVETGGPEIEVRPRLGTVSSSCGICGAEAIDDLRSRLHPLRPDVRWSPAVVSEVASKVRPTQALFDATGAVHAAAAFDASGALVVVREDIGRHNAVDKVVGRLRLDAQLPAHELGLFVSGRASFEMVQKAWAAAFGLVVAVSGPSALAVDTARAANLMLVGFARDQEMTVYSPEHPEWA